MFDYNSMTVIYLRMFLSLLAENITKVNKELAQATMTPLYDNNFTFCVLFTAGGLRVTLALQGDIYSLYLVTGTSISDRKNRVIKLGKTPHINKSMLNQLEVWFHREHRATYAEAIGVITDSIKLVNIKPFVNDIGWFKRLRFTQNVYEVSYGNSAINALMHTQVVVQRSLFNRLQVVVDAHTCNVSGFFTKFIPVHAGIMRTYYANATDKSLNRWVRELLLEHVEVHLK